MSVNIVSVTNEMSMLFVCLPGAILSDSVMYTQLFEVFLKTIKRFIFESKNVKNVYQYILIKYRKLFSATNTYNKNKNVYCFSLNSLTFSINQSVQCKILGIRNFCFVRDDLAHFFGGHMRSGRQCFCQNRTVQFIGYDNFQN